MAFNMVLSTDKGIIQVARGIIGTVEGDSGVELVRTCKMTVSTKFETAIWFNPTPKTRNSCSCSVPYVMVLARAMVLAHTGQNEGYEGLSQEVQRLT